jgi:hypothetical protein
MPDIDFDGKIYADATDEISHANRGDLYYEYYQDYNRQLFRGRVRTRFFFARVGDYLYIHFL